MTIAALYGNHPGGATRRRTALLLVWALLLGCMALHSGAEQHEALDGAKQVFLTCSRAAGASHLDTAQTIEQPPCPACVLQVQSVAAAVPVPQRLAGLVRFGSAALAQPALHDVAAPRLASSRGPPRA